MNYIILLVFAFLISFILVPVVREFSVKIDFVDKPTGRKMHDRPIPLLAGVAIYAAFFICYLISKNEFNSQVLAFMVSSLMVLGIGIIDDWYKTRSKEFPIWPRVIVQITAASIIFFSGTAFTGFYNSFNDTYLVLPYLLQYILSVLWIFGTMTVINWSDGLDGLAGGIASISAMTLFVVALAKGQPDSAKMAIILVGAILGYLKYNLPPASVFMGDAGATFIGFTLGVISLDGAFKQVTLISILIPILAIGVPIFDNIFVIIKRFLEGSPIYKADRAQIHYRLLSYGMKPVQVISFIFLISVCLSFAAIIILLLKV